MENRKNKNIIYRWARAISWGFVGWISSALIDRVAFSDLFNRFVSKELNSFFELFSSKLFIIVFVASLLFLLIGNTFKFAKRLHIIPYKKIGKFPPPWMFFCFGSIFYLPFSLDPVLLSISTEPISYLSKSLVLSICSFLFIFLLLCFDWGEVYDRFFKKLPVLQEEKESLKLLLDNCNDKQDNRSLVNELKNWASRQKDEIKQEEDIIGFSDCANEVYDLIDKHATEEGCYVLGLDGEFGSGKSSVLKLIKDQIVQDDKYIVIAVSCWEFESAHSIEAYLLKKIAAEVFQHIYASQLSNIIFSWRDRMDVALKDNSFFSFITAFNNVSLDEIMVDLSEALEASNKHLVLIVEDVDRRNGLKFDLGSLQRLLEYFKKHVRNMSVLIAADFLLHNGKNGSFDLSRLVDSSKQVPFLETEIIRKLLSVITYTLYSNPKGNEQFTPLWKENVQESVNYISVNDVCNHVGTPRKLKQFVLPLIEGWASARAHINFYDHFMIVLMKLCFKDVINFLNTYSHIFIKLENRDGDVAKNDPMKPQIRADFPEQWKEVRSRYSINEQRIIRIFVATIFPRVFEEVLDDRLSQVKDESPHANRSPRQVSDEFYMDVPESKRIIDGDNWNRYFKKI